MEKPKKEPKPFNPKKADKEIDKLAGNFKVYKINNENAKIIMCDMEALIQDGMGYSKAALQASEQFKR